MKAVHTVYTSCNLYCYNSGRNQGWLVASFDILDTFHYDGKSEVKELMLQ